MRTTAPPCIIYQKIKKTYKEKMLNRTTAPPITDAVDFNLKLKPYDFFTLDNGVPVYTINAGAQEQN